MPNLHVKPGPPLSRFVELLWYYENAPQPHQKERLMPDGCITLIINLLEDETRLYDPDDTKKVRRFRWGQELLAELHVQVKLRS